VRARAAWAAITLVCLGTTIIPVPPARTSSISEEVAKPCESHFLISLVFCTSAQNQPNLLIDHLLGISNSPFWGETEVLGCRRREHGQRTGITDSAANIIRREDELFLALCDNALDIHREGKFERRRLPAIAQANSGSDHFVQDGRRITDCVGDGYPSPFVLMAGAVFNDTILSYLRSASPVSISIAGSIGLFFVLAKLRK
jgi:hypothetical protein